VTASPAAARTTEEDGKAMLGAGDLLVVLVLAVVLTHLALTPIRRARRRRR
jgi:hypothetical protein